MILAVKTERNPLVHKFIGQVYDRMTTRFPHGAFIKSYNDNKEYLVICGFSTGFFSIVDYVAILFGIIIFFFLGFSVLLIVPAGMYLTVKYLHYPVFIMFKIGLRKLGYKGKIRRVDNEYVVNYLVVS